MRPPKPQNRPNSQLIAAGLVWLLLASACSAGTQPSPQTTGFPPGDSAAPSASATANPPEASPLESNGAGPPRTGLIAVAQGSDGGWIVRAVSADSMTERWRKFLSDRVTTLRWSPNEELLAILTREQLLIVSADGSDSEELDGGDALSWMPDSSTLAVERQGAIFLVNLDGKPDERVGPHWWLTGAELSPNGESLLFLSDERQDSPWVGEPMLRIYRLDLADGAVTSLTDLGYYGVTQFSQYGYLPGYWSPDGTRVATVTSNGMTFWTDALILDAATGAETPLGTGGWDASPWSPDGKRLLLDDARRAWIADGDGNPGVEIAAAPSGSLIMALGWSPDGSWAILQTAVESGTTPGTISIVSDDGQDVVELGTGYLAAWQPLR